MKISELKKEAKVKLSGCYKLAIGINLIHLLITLVLSYTASKVNGILGLVILLVASLINIPLGYGLTDSMLKLSRNATVGITDFITVGIKNFKRAFFLSLSILVRLIIPMILLIVASILPIIANFVGNIEGSSSGLISLVALLLTVSAFIYFFYKVLSYALSTYVLVDDEEAKSKDAIKRSAELMKGNKTRFILMVFSFIGWLFLAGIFGAIAQGISELLGTIVTYGLSLLLTPYITFTEINFYEELAGVSNVAPVEAEVVESTVE